VSLDYLALGTFLVLFFFLRKNPAGRFILPPHERFFFWKSFDVFLFRGFLVCDVKGRFPLANSQKRACCFLKVLFEYRTVGSFEWHPSAF